MHLRRADCAAHEDATRSFFDDEESVPDVQQLGDIVGVADLEHDTYRRSSGSTRQIAHELVAYSAVGFSGDIRKDPWASCRVEGSTCSDLAFASGAEEKSRNQHGRNCDSNERDAADREAVDHPEKCRDVGCGEQRCCANGMACFGDERYTAIGVGDSLVGAEQSKRRREWVLVEPSGMKPRSIREAERFTRWRDGRIGRRGHWADGAGKGMRRG